MTTYHESNVVELAGKILIVSILVASVVVVFVFFVHLYAKWFWYRREEERDVANTHRRRRRGDFTAGHLEQQSGVTVLRRGLDASFLKTIPVIIFDPKDFKEGFECTVCLSELGQGEKARILPKCSHGFHMECIDMWFHSHSTCPICRNPVSHQTEISVENLLESRQTQEESTENGDSREFPTNILFWGDETEVSTLTSQLEEANNHHQTAILTSETSSSSQPNRPDLVIDIPRLIDEDEGQKTPVSSRMRSFRRILSGSRMFINPFSPASTSVEQGSRGHR
ncbi:RING-H2 finger protein ATL3-like [Cynara cardunculus var. scolymus]|uniref:RING-type E3 ubiquitin transferase n=1 Tax=Cynara cardunculus var. scolymus TaxID=59895 RepID=A0A124SGA7_CYNCS|nr:RING-H2 finger protein ATL3-like [Cynara cardunculus var. scolymus]KVI05791.1 Zinc finger, RING/FYVE/PHD-type [Cynara cardunculus var. scolymus]